MAKKKERAEQIAALPLRFEGNKPRVLMVTSRETRRWVMPKGWTMDDKKPWQAAKIEALEEAGAKGMVADQKIGTYRYKKRLQDGSKIKCRVTVYPMLVEKLKRNWKERNERQRHWFSLKKAAQLVDEKDLSELLMNLNDKPKKRRMVQDLITR